MGNPFRYVRTGDPMVIPAKAYNAMVDAAQALQRRPVKHDPAKPSFSAFVLVENNTGKDLGQYSIVGLSGPKTEPNNNEFNFQNVPVLKGVVPKNEEHRGKIAIFQEPVRKGGIGRACLVGLTAARIKVSEENDNHSEQKVAVIVDDETGYLEQGTGAGSTILWIEPGTGEKWALLLLGSGVAAAAGEQYALIVKAGTRPSDPEAECPDNMGQGKIVGKHYREHDKPEDIAFPDAAEGEWIGAEIVKIVGPQEADNPDFDPDAGVSSSNPKKKTFYTAVDTKRVYHKKLNSDLEYDGTSTVTFTVDGEEKNATVHDEALSEGRKFKAGDKVDIERDGERLIVVDGPCMAFADDGTDGDGDSDA